MHLDVTKPYGPNGAYGDPDGDGLSNYQEFMGGTDPNVPDNYNALLTEPKLNANLP